MHVERDVTVGVIDLDDVAASAPSSVFVVVHSAVISSMDRRADWNADIGPRMDFVGARLAAVAGNFTTYWPPQLVVPSRSARRTSIAEGTHERPGKHEYSQDGDRG